MPISLASLTSLELHWLKVWPLIPRLGVPHGSSLFWI